MFAMLATSEYALSDPMLVDEEVTFRFPKQATAEDIYLALGRTAQQVCNSHAVYQHMNLAGEAQCRKEFIRDAVAVINRPALTNLHQNRTGNEVLILANSDK